MNTPISSLEKIPHFPVMMSEVIHACNLSKGGLFVDCTFGGGNYTKEFLKHPNTKVIALDRDQKVISKAKKIEEENPKKFLFFNERFSNLDKVISKGTKPDAIIFDLGLSMEQIQDYSRGFSFNSKEKIDMKMGLSYLSAEEVINTFDEKTLKLIIKIFGEEKEAAKIAKNIIIERDKKKISNTRELVEIIKKSKKKKL